MLEVESVLFVSAVQDAGPLPRQTALGTAGSLGIVTRGERLGPFFGLFWASFWSDDYFVISCRFSPEINILEEVVGF